jgi:ribosomal-protein-alanine N-acetyltransferase
MNDLAAMRTDRTERLVLEELAAPHAAELFAPLQSAELYTYIPDEPPASIAALAARYERMRVGAPPGETWRNWVMRAAADRVPVGTLQATIDDLRTLIAYVVLPAHWRRGYAREGVAWMLETLRRTHGVTRAEALIDTRNAASIALVESLGFARVETIANAGVVHGRPSDEHRYAKQLARA